MVTKEDIKKCISLLNTQAVKPRTIETQAEADILSDGCTDYHIGDEYYIWDMCLSLLNEAEEEGKEEKIEKGAKQPSD